jgi:hypothetical protein
MAITVELTRDDLKEVEKAGISYLEAAKRKHAGLPVYDPAAVREQGYPYGPPAVFTPEQLPPDKIMMVRKRNDGWESASLLCEDASDEEILGCFRAL